MRYTQIGLITIFLLIFYSVYPPLIMVGLWFLMFSQIWFIFLPSLLWELHSVQITTSFDKTKRNQRQAGFAILPNYLMEKTFTDFMRFNMTSYNNIIVGITFPRVTFKESFSCSKRWANPTLINMMKRSLRLQWKVATTFMTWNLTLKFNIMPSLGYEKVVNTFVANVPNITEPEKYKNLFTWVTYTKFRMNFILEI